MSGPGLSTVAARLKAAAPACTLPALIYMTDARRFPDPLPAAARLPRGAAIILRHYDDPDRPALAHALLRLARARGLKLLIGADPALALRIRADGVHWPEGLAKPRPRLKTWLVTMAAHSLPALIDARRAGADAALLSPVFATGSGDKHPLGTLRFAALATAAPLPVYALGGIAYSTAPRLIGSRATGLAAIAGLTPGVASKGATTL